MDCYRVTSDNSRGAGALNAPSASAGLDNVDHAFAVGNTWTISNRTVNETRAQFTYGDLKAPPTDPIGPAVSIAGVASFGTLSGSPTRRLNRMVQIVDNLSHQAGAHAPARRRRLHLQRRHDHVSASGARQLHVPVAARLSGRHLQRLHTDVRRPRGRRRRIPTLAMYVQDEWSAAAGLTLNLGLRYDLQFLHAVNTDTNNLSPRAGVAWSPSSHRELARFAEAPGSSSTACRCAQWPTRSSPPATRPMLGNLHQPSVSNIVPTQAGAPAFPEHPSGARADHDARRLHDDGPESAERVCSRQASVEVERSLGHGRTVSVGYLYLRGSNLLMSVNQNVPTCAAAGTNNGCRPNPAYRNNNQYSSVGESNYHGLHVSLVQRPSEWASLRVSYTLSKSMNDLGEAFFSSPIDPTDISRDWGRSDDDQRHRLVIDGTLNTSMAPATTAWEHLSHGFQVSGMLQCYLVAAVQHRVGCGQHAGDDEPAAGRWRDGAAERRRAVRRVHPAERGTGSDFFTLNLRVSRTFRIGKRR